MVVSSHALIFLLLRWSAEVMVVSAPTSLRSLNLFLWEFARWSFPVHPWPSCEVACIHFTSPFDTSSSNIFNVMECLYSMFLQFAWCDAPLAFFCGCILFVGVPSRLIRFMSGDGCILSFHDLVSCSFFGRWWLLLLGSVREYAVPGWLHLPAALGRVLVRSRHGRRLRAAKPWPETFGNTSGAMMTLVLDREWNEIHHQASQHRRTVTRIASGGGISDFGRQRQHWRSIGWVEKHVVYRDIGCRGWLFADPTHRRHDNHVSAHSH